MSKIVDPDSLNQGTEIILHSGEGQVQLLVAGNLDDNSPGATSGVAMQAVYSFCKEEWKAQTNLNKYKFPIKALTKFKFDWQNGWRPYDAQTRELLRDGGWKEADGAEWTCIVSLGDIHANADQSYYQKVGYGFDETAYDFDKTGELNEAYMSFSGEAGMDYTSFLKIFSRVGGKTFSEGNLIADQGWTSIEYDTYRMPLSNADDPNVSVSGEVGMAGAPYNGMSLQYIPGTTYETFDYGELPYSSGEVLFSGERWYQVGYHVESSANAPPHADYVSFSGERELASGEFYAYNRIVTGNDATNQQIYEFSQFRLFSGENINNDALGLGFGTVKGQLGKELLNFVGTTLVTQGGVFIDGYNVNYKNSIEFYDITKDGGGLDSDHEPATTTKRTFPFTAAGTITFSSNLVDDSDAMFWMYFDNAGGNAFNSENATLVQDADGLYITGEVSSASRNFSFDYTNNNQGGRTPDTDANIVIVAMGLNTAEYVLVENLIISEATGLSFIVTAPDERNYSNP